ncbi:WD40 repeat-like protein [Macroventuria anomochaeta]|uniref:WD40 repeat-like protein n=1 Tax=Macroventuria anomochaeta TaxID=301207 RepID=A0ACB6RVR0_9PLEO|nr:WD40 repeat-like protein [Macroventuria anomochaeta]KAF2625510.1 WD40 repeat-like protein [Macroventuria anomochaeta]
MRLLKYGEDGEFSVTPDLVDEHAIPCYAILSHTWAADADEVTFEDLAKNAGKDKSGYKKIQLCGEQAKRDGLQHFWIDTCCINKANKAEHSLAIQSMFRWYRNAARCYVYLPDVSAPPLAAEREGSPPLWDSEFRESRWFTRGWTLQELLAPGLVEFHSREWHRLGDRVSLQSQIYEITTIPRRVLEGAPLSQSTIEERFRWRQNRHTKLKEDAAYSLSGIFDVDIAPVYGEGAEEAFRRLHDRIRKREENLQKREECLRDLRPTDPRNDKKRIEDTKGGLLEGSYRWVFDNSSFQEWRNDAQSQLLWIKGDPGKGKTMLLCGIINELQKTIASTASVTYFFCQATDSRINNATAVLRGLLYLLVSQQPALITHIRKTYDQAGKTMFEDANAWVALTEIFADVLQDLSLGTTYMIIDALDECVTDLPKLLHLVIQGSSASSHVKWIVSSRNWPGIEEQLEQAGHKVRLSLELNAESVSAAVSVFIQHKVSQLAQQKKYDKQTQDAVFERLTTNANDTFLWVALVCQDLQATARRNVLKKLDSFPPGLNALYERMMQQISVSDDAELCKQVLASIALVYRPITLEELVVLAEALEDMVDKTEVRDIIGLCGSFLTLREDTVYFVHQSAKDFLVTKAFDEIFPDGTEAVHRVIFSRSLVVLSRTLHRDMYSLEELGFSIDNVKTPDPDPLVASRYPCIYWVDHLYDSKPKSWANSDGDVQVGGVVYEFIGKRYLYWLEGLSLCKSTAKGIVSVSKLCSLAQEMWDTDKLTALVQDARRFFMYHKGAIESFPLQTYASALLFSPTGSVIKRLFQHEEPEGITIKPVMSDRWSACLQTLEGHSNGVSSVAFSHDSTKLASASYDNTVKLWDANSGACLQTFTGHSNVVSSVVFSHDSTKLASASYDSTVKLWDVSSSTCLQTFNIGKTLYNLLFDSTNSYLRTEIGTISIDNSETSSIAAVAEPECPPYLGSTLNSDNTWIKHDGKNMLWVPSEYRPSCSSVRGTKVGMGVGYGRVWTCNIDLPHARICL